MTSFLNCLPLKLFITLSSLSFSQFYTKIDFLENFATEPFNEICDIIDDHDLANMRELRNFVKYHGAEYGLPSMKVIRSVMKMSSGIVRLTFDAVYQERRYGKQIDNETGEIK